MILTFSCYSLSLPLLFCAISVDKSSEYEWSHNKLLYFASQYTVFLNKIPEYLFNST